MTGEVESFSYYRGKRSPSFVTETEREAARILDYYRVPWCYEPRTFILERDEEGNIVEAFTPDFYLPELDLYLEVTQMKQSLVTAKNRKVRRLREKYPEVRVRLLYKKDFVQLAKKYRGTAELASSPPPSLVMDSSLPETAATIPHSSQGAPAPPAPRDPVVIGEVQLSAEDIAQRVHELGAEISRDYEGRELLLVAVLKGTLFFLTDLARAITRPVELDFLAITRYGAPDLRMAAAGAPARPETGAGAVRFLKDLDRPIEGRHLLIVEDIVDTGLTLHYVLRSLQLREPASVEVCTFLDRPYRRLVDVPVRYRGFTVPDSFFVGYGFDHEELHRNLPYLAQLPL